MIRQQKKETYASDREAQYDERAKRVAGSKIVIANILSKTVDAFRGMKPRAVFYVSRQISSQKERDFVKSHYDDIKSAYSIWICMNMEENSLCHIHLTKEDIIGNKQWGGNPDLFHIIMIGIGKELPEHNEIYELHRLLGTLFSKELSRKDKIGILKEEYDITEDDNLGEDVSEMCNLSQGIKEDGIAIGLEKGREDGIAIGRKDGIAIGETGLIQNMHKNGFTAEQIAAATDKDLEDVKAILRNK